MNATIRNNSFDNRITLTSDELALFMGCGRKAAVTAGMEAGARVQIGRRRGKRLLTARMHSRRNL